MLSLNHFQKTCLSIAVGASLSLPLQAATIFVDSSRDNGAGAQCTLREAIQSSNTSSSVGGCIAGTQSASDDIVISDLVTTINLLSALPPIEQDLTLTGLWSNRVTINGNGFGSVLRINQSKVQITNVTVTGGNAENTYGGGIHAENSILTLSKCEISENTSEFGAGIRISNGTSTITDSLISRNTAQFQGGGVFSYNASTTITNSTILENTALIRGGGVFSYNAFTTITDTTISANMSERGSGGGGFYYGVTNINNSTFFRNTTGRHGGGINLTEGTVTISHSTLSGNSSVERGGGVYSNQGTHTITNSTLSGNSAGYGGGAFFENGTYENGTATITNSTLTGNKAVSGGGLFTAATSLTLSNSIIAGNVVSNQAPEIIDVYGVPKIQSQNNLFGSSANTALEAFIGFAPSNSDVVATSDGLNIPLNQIISPLADNGGRTLTHDLPSNSPAINAGRNSVCPSTDQRGIARNDGRCDIGAVEIANSSTFYVIPLANGGSVVIEL